MTAWRRVVPAAAAALAAAASGCGGNAEIARSRGGGGGSAGTAAAGTDAGLGGTGGSVVLPDGGGGIGGGPPPMPCAGASCLPGQRCEVVDGGAVCVDNECSDLQCSETERCEPHPQGGHVCESIACSSDVDCAPQEYCDGTKCVDDVCQPGERECSGQQLLECASNGGASVPQYTCGSPSYFDTKCVSGAGGAGCSCEDDWDCPANTVCEVDRCVGTGVAPTCTLPPIPFTDVPPAVEIHWGGSDRDTPAAHDGTPAQNPAPWPLFAHVVSTPIVANLDDDNGDGLVNELDFPEIVFVAHQDNSPWDDGVVRAIHGGGPLKGADYLARCGDKLWTRANPISDACNLATDPDGDSGAPVAVGDLDGNGLPEIVMPTDQDTIRILDNTGAEIYHLAMSWAPSHIGETVAIANLDYAGYAEIIVGRNVLLLGDDGGGNLIVTHVLTGTGGEGVNGPGPMACPADLVASLPGQEIVAGATLYRLPDTIAPCGSPPCTGSLEVVWNAPDLPGQAAQLTGEGYCAVADVWGADPSSPPGPGNPPDGKPEVVLIDDGDLTILNAETGEIIDDRDLGGGDRGGAPNVDDFDGDGFMEIASALRDFYRVVDLQASTGAGGSCPDWPQVIARQEQADGSHNPNPARTPGGACTTDGDCDPAAVCNTQAGRCVCLHNGWFRDSDDDSSRVTSSSVFDFNGDGAAEVLYNDECDFRVYDGVTGNILYSQLSRSRTGIENPVVADVDNDGNAEVVTGMNTERTSRCDDDPPGDTLGPNGIRVWGDPTDTWVSARRIWNQQSYHVVNVTEGGGIPAHPPESWGSFNGRTYNTYRSQPRSFGVAPDLVVADVGVSSPGSECGALSTTLDIAFEIANAGDLRVGPGVKVTFEGRWMGSWEQLLDGSGQPLEVVLTTSLEPGKSVILSVGYDPADNGKTVLPDRVRVVVDAEGRERECDETNNELETDVAAGTPRPDVRVEVGAATPDCPDGHVAVTVCNDGTVEASDVVVRYYAGDPSAGGAPLGEETVAGPLAPGECRSFTASLQDIPPNRNLVVYAVADPEDVLDECNEANNADSADNPLSCGSIR